MKTPCTELGYRVGDRFEVVTEDLFSKGSVVELYEDEGTIIPLFKLISGSCRYNNLPDDTAGAYEDLRHMKKIEDASNTSTNKPEEKQKKQPNTDIRWAKIPNGKMPDSFFEDIAVMFEGLPLEYYLREVFNGGMNWECVGFDGEEVIAFDNDDYDIKENGREIPYQYSKAIQKKEDEEEDQDELDKAFDLLEKRLKLKADLDNKTSSAVSTLTRMGFKYVDGKWTFNAGE